MWRRTVVINTVRSVAFTLASAIIQRTEGNARDLEEFLLAVVCRPDDSLQKIGAAVDPTKGHRATTTYNIYISMTALKMAMRSAGFTCFADTEKLISAFESPRMPQGPDFPDGAVLMNRADHQGRTK